MMRETHKLVRASLTGGIFVALAACSGGGGPTADAGGTAITGVAAKGLMSGTTVQVFLVDADGFPDTETGPLAETTTSEIGRFELAQRPDPGALLLVTRGGSYLDESDPAPLEDKRRVFLDFNEGFEALLPAGQSVVAITPYSQMLVERARAEADPGRFLDFFDVIRQRVSGVLGFDPVSDLPADPIQPGSAGAASRAYAMALGGFAQQVNSTAIRLGVQPSYDIVRAVQDDMIDGVLDGQNANEPVLLFIGDDTFVLPVFDFNLQIERFRNNNFGAYGAAQLVIFDEDVLSGPITINNTPPVVDDFAFTVAQGGSFLLQAPGLLDSASDVDNDQLGVETTPVAAPQSGGLTLNADGSFEYEHDNSATTQDSFQFAVIDGNGGRTIATVTITITPAQANRVYNTAFFEIELSAPRNGQEGEFSVAQDRGFYDISLAQQPRIDVTVGPFELLGDVDQITFDSGDGGQSNTLFFDEPGRTEAAETLTVNRGSDGVLFLDPVLDFFLGGTSPQTFDRSSDDTTLVVPVRDDVALTTGLDFEERIEAIASTQAPQGAYISGSPLGLIGNEFNMYLEIGLEQSSDFDVSRLQGDYGFAGLGVVLENTGSQAITAFRIEHSPDATGVATGETFDFNEIVYTPIPLSAGGSTSANPNTGSSQTFQTIYSTDSTGVLAIEYRDDGVVDGTPSGLASPDGEIVIIQEVISNGGSQSFQPDSVEHFFQVGVRRPAGTVDLSGQSFRWSMLRVERSADDQNSALNQFNNVPVTFGTGGTCTIDIRLGQNAYVADRATDTGPLSVEVDDIGISEMQACSYTTGAQGAVSITVPGDQTDPNGDTYTGYVSESGDIMVLQHVRDETGFFQRGMVVGYLDTGVTTPDNRQPEVTVQPTGASVADGGTLDLQATISDPDNGPAPTDVQWISTIGAFTSLDSPTTQWVAPSGESGTTLLTAVVDDGQRLRVVDIPVDFGQGQSLPKAGADPILGLRRFADNSLLLPDDLDFVFTLFNPFDTRDGNYSCQGDGQQIPDGTVTQQFNDNDQNGLVTAGDTASLTFNDCADFDLIRNGTIDFTIGDNETIGTTEVITYSVVLNYNETLPNDPEYVDFSGSYDAVYEDDSNAADPTETYTVASSSEFVATINESAAVPSPINNGVRVSLPAGYQFAITRFFEFNRYSATGDFTVAVEEIVDNALTGNSDSYVLQITSPLTGEWTANLPGGPTEAGVPQGLGNPFSGDFTVVMGSADLSPPQQNYRFLSNGDAGTPRADVLFDTAQDGSFDVEIKPTWDDIFENRGLGGELQGQIDARPITVDGGTADWTGGSPNVTRRIGDPASPDGDVTAVWAAQDGGDLVLRLDVDGNIDTTGFQYDWVFVPYNETETACPEVTLDLDNFGSTSEFCQLFVFDANGAVLNGCQTDGTSQPVFGSATNTLEAAFPLADLPFATHLKVFYGSAVTAPPDFQNFVRSIPPFCVDLLD